MTNQEVYDIVLFGLRKQGRASVFTTMTVHRRAGACAYRGTSGTKCAAGWLIPDEKYSPSMEGVSVNDPAVFAATGLLLGQRGLLLRLQCVHDAELTQSLDHWERAMQVTAKSYGLTYTPPEGGFLLED